MKIRKKERRLCGGKLIVTSFKKLNPEEGLFLGEESPGQFSKELAAYTIDGKVYINTEISLFDVAAGVFETFIPESRETLKQYQIEYSKKFPNIKNFEDWGEYAKEETDNEKIVQALAVLMVPLELKRRVIEAEYYGKIKAFPS